MLNITKFLFNVKGESVMARIEVTFDGVHTEDHLPILKIFYDLGIHPMVGAKMFLRNQKRLNYQHPHMEQLPFYGRNINPTGNLKYLKTVFVTAKDAKCIIETYRRYVCPQIKCLAKAISASLKRKEAKIQRTDLAVYVGKELPFEATLHDITMYYISHTREYPAIVLTDLKDPNTEHIYANHVNVFVSAPELEIYSQFKLPMKMTFLGTVYSYMGSRRPKYAVRDLRQVKLMK
jgi:hypothetical protein